MNSWVGDYLRRALIQGELISKNDIFLKGGDRNDIIFSINQIKKFTKRLFCKVDLFVNGDFFTITTKVAVLFDFAPTAKGSNTL